jgi:hypothetical protein
LIFCSILVVLSKDRLSLWERIKGINKEMNPMIRRKKKTNVVTVARLFGNRNRVFKKLIIGFPIRVRIKDTRR